jgi:hypothetical protein
MSKAQASQTDEEYFDEIASEIMSNRLYAGEPASLTVSGVEQAIHIVRKASYLTASRTGRVLEGTDSTHIGGNNDFETTDICHPVVVGETYASGKRGGDLFKVVKAEVLVPGSAGRSKAKKRHPKLRLVPARSFVPV